MNFSTALAHEHAMLLVFVVPHLALGVAFVWEETGKKRANAASEASLYRANSYDESPVWIAASGSMAIEYNTQQPAITKEANVSSPHARLQKRLEGVRGTTYASAGGLFKADHTPPL